MDYESQIEKYPTCGSGLLLLCQMSNFGPALIALSIARDCRPNPTYPAIIPRFRLTGMNGISVGHDWRPVHYLLVGGREETVVLAMSLSIVSIHHYRIDTRYQTSSFSMCALLNLREHA